ncbi:MAG: SufD family Fe-S cluster assembly protein [Rickettsiales bacterium]|nr:SufD family Fe-S cluster assembly protein [Rickettsiales bacterium]
MVITFKERAAQILRLKNKPNRKNEEWRYSDLSLLDDKVNEVDKEFSYSFSPDKKSYYITLINGILDKNKSNLPEKGIALYNTKDKKFLDLLDKFDLQEGFDNKYHILQNYARTSSSLLVDISSSLNKPLKIYYLNNRNIYCSVFITIKKGENVALHEELIQQSNFTNQVTNITLEDDSHCKHLKLHNYIDDECSALYSSKIICNKDSKYYNYTLNAACNSYRQNIECYLQGEKSSCDFYGINIGKDKQKYDIILTIKHQNPHTNSRQHYNQILSDNAKGSFYGKVEIPSSLYKIEAHQLNKNLLLEETAQAFTRPQLNINSDDVICSHGATIGNIDKDAIDYLKSRGINNNQAQKLIIKGFTKAVFEGKNLTQEEFESLSNQIANYLD